MSISRLVNFFVLRTVEADLTGNVAEKIIFRTSPCRKFIIFTFRLNITEYITQNILRIMHYYFKIAHREHG